MFTGLVQALGQVSKIENQGGITSLSIATDLPTRESIAVGDSVCTSGVCLTVVSRSETTLTFELASETLRVTALSQLKLSDPVNLETSLRVGDKLGGHFVFGHVDGVGTVAGMRKEGDTTVFSFSYPEALQGLLATKGSVAIDGVSLTVGKVTAETFDVFIIPHTLSHTTFSRLGVGDPVNLEVDMLARYVKSICEAAR